MFWQKRERGCGSFFALGQPRAVQRSGSGVLLVQRKNKQGKALPQPVVKWAGGKGQLLDRYSRVFPPAFNAYHEPFAGGAAVFFAIRRRGWSGKAYLNDLNPELINLYVVIRDNFPALMEELKVHEAHKNNRDYYYEVRNWDRNPRQFSRLSPAKRAARTLFLNKTCYNGLYRVNRSDYFNVPFGRIKNPRVLDGDNLQAVSLALQDVSLTCRDFEVALAAAGPGDFVYLDPPYQPLTRTASFTAYTRDSFSLLDQQRLARLFAELEQRGCWVMLSNSYTPEIQALYQGYSIQVVQASRAINSRTEGRGPVEEMLITSYRPRDQSLLE